MDYITRTLLDSAALKQQVAAAQADVIHAMVERRACATALRVATHEGLPSWKPY